MLVLSFDRDLELFVAAIVELDGQEGLERIAIAQNKIGMIRPRLADRIGGANRARWIADGDAAERSDDCDHRSGAGGVRRA